MTAHTYISHCVLRCLKFLDSLEITGRECGVVFSNPFQQDLIMVVLDAAVVECDGRHA